MADWRQVQLTQDGALAWWTQLTPSDSVSELRVVGGALCSVQVLGGPVDVLGSLGLPDLKPEPLRDPTGTPLTTISNCLEAIGPRVDAIQVKGIGIVTLYARRA